jgi:hypothetical protein
VLEVGRPRIPEYEKKIAVSIGIPKWLHEKLKQSGNVSEKVIGLLLKHYEKDKK